MTETEYQTSSKNNYPVNNYINENSEKELQYSQAPRIQSKPPVKMNNLKIKATERQELNIQEPLISDNFRSNFGSKFNEEPISSQFNNKENEPSERSFSKKSMQSFTQNPDTVSKFMRVVEPTDGSLRQGKNLATFLNDSKQALQRSR